MILKSPISNLQSPRFFIRADGQYFITTEIFQDEAWRVAGVELFKTITPKTRTGCLGFYPDGNGTILTMEEFFLN